MVTFLGMIIAFLAYVGLGLILIYWLWTYRDNL